MRYLTPIVLAALAAIATPAAAVNLVTNGDFESTTSGTGQLGYNTNLTGWTVTPGSYNFVFNGATSDSTGATGQYGAIKLKGPGDGFANGLGASPTGGNFVTSDAPFHAGSIKQVLTGLTTGKEYAVDFYWAAAQQFGFNGKQTEQWTVSFGGATKSTAVFNNAAGGFSGWMHEHFVFNADSTAPALSFLANGTPRGAPPFTLLDGVSVTAVPEPATWAMMVAGLGLVGGAVRRRRIVVAA